MKLYTKAFGVYWSFIQVLCNSSFLNTTFDPSFDIVEFIWRFSGRGFEPNSSKF
jgi:hypothetical protein